jgi:hypothetical protein
MTLLLFCLCEFIALTISNFIYQGCINSVPNYNQAMERSFFQFIALMGLTLTCWLLNFKLKVSEQ